MSANLYVHGYSDRESERLSDQAQTLTGILHGDTRYPAGSKVLEAGCGIGAQTVILARNSPGACITSVDISPESVKRAQERIRKEGIANVTVEVGDLFMLPFKPELDHIFVCFVLEHLRSSGLGAGTTPASAPGWRFYHSDRRGPWVCIFLPGKSTAAKKAVQCLCRSPEDWEAMPLSVGGSIHLSQAPVLPVSGLAPDSLRRCIAAGPCRRVHETDLYSMVEGVQEEVVDKGMMSEEEWERGYPGPVQHLRAGRGLLLHVLQGNSRK